MENTRPFRILGLQQIAIGARNKKTLHKLWIDCFGLSIEHSFQSKKENVLEDVLSIGSGNARVEIDLMQPLDPEKKPRVHLPPLNHIGLWVDDLNAAVSWLKNAGVRFTPGGIRPGASGFNVCFIHPKGNEHSPIGGAGVLIELVQAPKKIIDAFS